MISALLVVAVLELHGADMFLFLVRLFWLLVWSKYFLSMASSELKSFSGTNVLVIQASMNSENIRTILLHPF